jgi:hypothetical protein
MADACSKPMAEGNCERASEITIRHSSVIPTMRVVEITGLQLQMHRAAEMEKVAQHSSVP